ncbi:MAG: flagellar biosynthesis anti-sigma factor FlgM [Gammaproteobacteria bacterium]|nr:flagellar biosynthesis anti-sigma factor FlgM [Gammaproteobacteria bacterium]
MTDAINTTQHLRSTPTATEAKGNSAKSSEQQSPAASSSTVVDIKSTKLAESLSAQVDKTLHIDTAKVESIKLALANGDYQPNPEMIAQKFIEIEKLL